MKKMILCLGMTIAIIFFSGCINGLSIEDVHNIEQQNDSDVMTAPILPLGTEEFEQFPQEAIQRNNKYANNEISVYLDGERLEFDVSPKIIDGRKMVPMRVIFEAFGAEVEWDGATQRITATRYDIGYYAFRVTITMHINNPLAIVQHGDSAEGIDLDVAPFIADNRTLVPLRAVSEFFDAMVIWDANTNITNITTNITPRHQFTLTLSVEETIVRQGESLRVNVELQNNSNERHKIVYSVGVRPIIPTSQIFAPTLYDTPPGEPRFFEAGGIIRNLMVYPVHAGFVEPGTHELIYYFLFWIVSEEQPEESKQRIRVESNTVTFTVLPT